MTPRAVIDIGTNSLKLIVGRSAPSGLDVLFEDSLVTRLGEGLHLTGRLGEAPMERCLAGLEGFAARARELGAVHIDVIGTMALRKAANSEAFASALSERCALALRVISGDEEARLSHIAAVSALELPDLPLCVFDVGGGSTDLSFGRLGMSESRLSIELGCRRPSEEILRSDPAVDTEVDALLAYVENTLAEALAEVRHVPSLLVGVGGTATTLSSVAQALEPFDASKVHGQRMTLDQIEGQIDRYRGSSLAERRRIAGLNPERADVALVGAAIVAGVLRAFRSKSFVISHRGMRFAILQAACEVKHL